MRIVLRKSLFPGRAEREIPRHEPLAVRPTADGGRLQLLRSETNPAVRRWRRLGPQVRLHYSERARAVLREAATGNGQVTRRRLEHPDIRELVEHGLITVHEEPAHHAFEYSTRITAAGREYLRRIEGNVKRQAKEAQVAMFKGRILLRKATQLGMFGGAAHPDRTPPGVTEVRAHLARNPGGRGVHVVQEHRRAVSPDHAAVEGATTAVTKRGKVVDVIPRGQYEVIGYEDRRPIDFESGKRLSGSQDDAVFCHRCDRKHWRVFKVRGPAGTFDVGEKCAEQMLEGFDPAGDQHVKSLVRDVESAAKAAAAAHRAAHVREAAHEAARWALALPEPAFVDLGVVQLEAGAKVRRFALGRTDGGWSGQRFGDVEGPWSDEERAQAVRRWRSTQAAGRAREGRPAGPLTEDIKRLASDVTGAPEFHGLRKAASAAASGAGPAAKGLRLVASKVNPRVKRWERMEAKPPAEHVRYRHPETGEESHGLVTGGGAKGITVADHATGRTVRVHHGHYVASEPPQASPGPAPAKGKAAPAKGAKAPAKAAPDEPKWREELPGLNKYPPPGVKPDRGGPGDDWRLRWRSPTTGKMVQAYDTAYLRDNARQKFDRIRGLAAALPNMRRDTAAHLALHPETEAAVKAAMLRLVDATAMRAGNEDSATKGVHGVSTLLKKHVRVSGDTVTLDYVGKSSVPQRHEVTDPHLAAVVKHLQSLPGDRLFQARTPGGALEPVTAAKLNDYVRDHLGADHTLKDLRTFHATRLWAEAADRLGPPGKGEDPEEKIKAAAMEVARHLGHKKASTRAHFAVHPPGEAADHELAGKHGGKVYMHGERRAVGFHTAAELKTYMKASGAAKLHKDEHPEVGEEWLHEPMTSLNNYIDPTVVHAYRKGLTLSGGMRKGTAPGHDGLTPDEARFVDHLEHVRQLDPYKFRGGAP